MRRMTIVRGLIASLSLILIVIPQVAFGLTASQVYERVQDSVVVVKAYDRLGKMVGLGSGVMLPSGEIVTNHHVVKAGVSYTVSQRGQAVKAYLKGSDPDKDLSLLLAPGLTATPARLGQASRLKVGEKVFAVGAPQGLELSLSEGIVSQLRGGPPPIIQTTVAISPGSSGGGLFNEQGELVGITTFYLKEGQGLNFALPVEWVRDVAMLKIPEHPREKTTVIPEPEAIPKDGRAEQAPTFEGSVGFPGPREESTQGGKFNKFMQRNNGNIVYLFIFLDHQQQSEFQRSLTNPDEYNRIIFSVKDDYSKHKLIDSTGCEYLIHLPSRKEDFNFEYINGAGRLSGCFKIWDINGPRQGFLSVNLRPVRCQK